MNTDDLYRMLRTDHARAQGIVDTVADPMLVLDGALCVTAASRSFFQRFAVDSYETIGKPLFELGNGQWDIPQLRHLLLEVIPNASAIVDYEVKHDFPGLGPRTMLLTARTLYQPDGNSHAILLVIVDVTDQQARDAAKDLLFGELRHRMKNLLGVIQALARQTTTRGRTAEEYKKDLIGRIDALIEAENAAFDAQHGTDLKDLIEHILAPYSNSADAVRIEPGPDVDLSPPQVMSLAMVLHEMATNAAKYGALSTTAGQVHVRWQVAEDGQSLTLDWSESGCSPRARPASQGFGSTLIEATVDYRLRGKMELNYGDEGLSARIVIPIGGADLRD